VWKCGAEVCPVSGSRGENGEWSSKNLTPLRARGKVSK
jgi:hypothetical protein